ncbi:hypothetical protein HPB51_014555 [Rhipicephalus microplus]|uniref:Ig-like domain-containing protein n=1 Tax=Rhipicephalus microplus TaxID=6941 RepID=A0A9J6DNF9_RHIMP|nr:hypothetical protein HPB51_014555 [Rhipicephalus microplus]
MNLTLRREICKPSRAFSQGGVGGGRAPRITEQPVDVVVRKHEPVTLRCGADGEPPPRIAWFHDGKSVRDSAKRMILPEDSSFPASAAQPPGARHRTLLVHGHQQPGDGPLPKRKRLSSPVSGQAKKGR